MRNGTGLRGLGVVALAGVAVCASGCISESVFSISASSKSIESSLESSSSPFRSSSESSGMESVNEANYRHDVRDFVAAWVKSGGDQAAFQQTLASLAKKHGISDWQGDRSTWVGVGQGLAKAKVQGVALQTYETNLTGGDAERIKAVREGYQKEQ